MSQPPASGSPYKCKYASPGFAAGKQFAKINSSVMAANPDIREGYYALGTIG